MHYFSLPSVSLPYTATFPTCLEHLQPRAVNSANPQLRGSYQRGVELELFDVQVASFDPSTIADETRAGLKRDMGGGADAGVGTDAVSDCDVDMGYDIPEGFGETIVWEEDEARGHEADVVDVDVDPSLEGVLTEHLESEVSDLLSGFESAFRDVDGRAGGGLGKSDKEASAAFKEELRLQYGSDGDVSILGDGITGVGGGAEGYGVAAARDDVNDDVRTKSMPVVGVNHDLGLDLAA